VRLAKGQPKIPAASTLPVPPASPLCTVAATLASAPPSIPHYHRCAGAGVEIPMPELGNVVPALTAPTPEGGTLALDAFKGQWVVLYFYPKDSTPGCTTEAQQFRDLYPQLRAHGAEVLGVSRDSLKSHANFAAKQNLPFPLVSDADESWCRAFDVIHEKVLYGKRHMGVVRSTFLIDTEGTVVREWRGVKVPGHAQAVLDALIEAQ